MVISIFTPPEEGKEWNECKTGDICDCLTFEYEKHFNGAGTFTLELPITTRFRDKVVVGSVLVTSDGDALIVKNIQTTLDKVKVTGYDLNGILADRIILATDTDGTAPVDGSTEYCVKYYVENNLYDCEQDANRNLPRFAVSPNQDRGDPYDHNMPRYAKLNDVVTEMCGAAKLGWRVSLNESTGGSAPVFLFDVAEQVDRSVNQNDRNRVIFSVQQHNVSSMTREVGVTEARNALYLDIDGTVVGYPQADDDSGRTVAAGYSRREEYCALSGDSLDFDTYKVEAEQNIADRMSETDSLTIEAGNPSDYRSKYDVGDIVTVYDRERSLQLDSVISAVTVRRSGSEYSVKLTLGESKPKLLDRYAKKGEVVGRVVRDKAGKVINSTAMTGYEYLSDDSVKFNGVTYTVERDSATGLISKITDSGGNSFAPTINSGIADVTLHNAVFWAVAMCRGISSVKLPQPVVELTFENSLANTGTGNYPVTSSGQMDYTTGITGDVYCYSAVYQSQVTVSGLSDVLNGDFTAVVWFKKNPSSGNARLIWFTFNDSYYGVEFQGSSCRALGAGFTSGNYSDVEWHSCAIIKSGSRFAAVFDGEETLTCDIGVTSNSGDLTLSWNSAEFFHGYIDSLRLYDRALTDDELKKALALK